MGPRSVRWWPIRPFANYFAAASISLTYLDGSSWLWCTPNIPSTFVAVLGCNQVSTEVSLS